MTSADDMIAHLKREPESEIVAAMLTDELMESRGMLRTEADRHIVRLCTEARDALDIAWTAALLRAKGPAYLALRKEVERVCELAPDASYTLYVVAGSAAPTTGVPLASLGAQRIGLGVAVSLPATWVRRWHATSDTGIKPPRPRRPRPGGR